jgi:hypothetical protein
VSDEAALSDSNGAALRQALIPDRNRNVFIRMVLVDDQNPLCDQDIPLQMNSIFGVNLATPVNHAIIIDYDYRLPFFLGRNAQP